MTQGFFHELVLGGELIQRANKDKGRFRTFLLTALKHYVINVYWANARKKRRPAGAVLSLEAFDEGSISISSQENPEGERTVGIVLYYAAIANALLFHKTTITAHSHQTLKAEFNKLSDKSWMSKELARLFTKAVKAIESLSQ